MLWTACSSSERSSHPDVSLHAPDSTDLRIYIINRRLVTLLGTTSVFEASGCEKGATAGDSTWLARVKICLICAAVWRSCTISVPWWTRPQTNRLICAAVWRSCATGVPWWARSQATRPMRRAAMPPPLTSSCCCRPAFTGLSPPPQPAIARMQSEPCPCRCSAT